MWLAREKYYALLCKREVQIHIDITSPSHVPGKYAKLVVSIMARRTAAQDELVLAAKQAPSQLSDAESNISVNSLTLAGQAKFKDSLHFNVEYKASKGSHLIVYCKVCHWHPQAGSISRTIVAVHEDVSFFLQVLLRSKTVGKIKSVDEFLSVSEMMTNLKGWIWVLSGHKSSCATWSSRTSYDVKQLRHME